MRGEPMKHKVRVGAGVLLTVLLVATAACSNSSSSSTTTTGAGQTSGGPVRGLTGNTLTVGGIWSTANFPGAEVGAEAYFAQINQTNYLNGIKIKFAGFVNDNQDPATALSGVRQLVNQDNVFAIVPDLSAVNPGTYLASQKILYVGGGFDFSYCSPTVTTSLWGYAFAGCLVPSNPPVVPDTYGQYYNYVKTKTGSANPTMAIFSNDNASGSNSVKLSTVSAKGAGFKVVYNKADVPITASDYTPYVQQMLTSNNGKAPQAIACQLTEQCIPMWTALKNAGYTGAYWIRSAPSPQTRFALRWDGDHLHVQQRAQRGATTMQNAMNAITPGTS